MGKGFFFFPKPEQKSTEQISTFNEKKRSAREKTKEEKEQKKNRLATDVRVPQNENDTALSFSLAFKR